MNNHCSTCNKDFNDAKALRDHRSYMRKQGKITGHEIKEGYSSKGSVAGSLVGTKDTNINDLEFMPPDERYYPAATRQLKL